MSTFAKTFPNTCEPLVILSFSRYNLAKGLGALPKFEPLLPAKPLYGDVFGVAPRPKHKHIVVDKTMFGVIQVQEEEAQSDYEIEEESIPEEDDLEARLAELPDEHPPEILMIESFESEAVETGIETPAFIPLRKEKIDKQVIKPLYTVLTQKAGVEGFMGSMHTYDISKTVEVALNDNELEMSEEVLKRKFDEANDPGVSSKGIGFKKHEDLGDLVQEHLSKKHKKEDKKDDKKKGFKF